MRQAPPLPALASQQLEHSGAQARSSRCCGGGLADARAGLADEPRPTTADERPARRDARERRRQPPDRAERLQSVRRADPRPAGGREVIENPTVADVMMTGTLPEMAFGRADAPVTIVQYASLTCPHCRNFHRETFPAVQEGLHRHRQGALHPARVPDRQDRRASRPSRCAAPSPRNTSTLYGKFMEQQAILGLPGGAARPHIQRRRAGGDDAAAV